MTRIILEEPFWLALAAAPVLFVLWGIWNRARSTITGRLLVGGLLATGALFLIQRLVVTDRERLQTTTRTLSDAVSNGNLDVMLDLIHPDAVVRGVGPPAQLRDTVSRLLQRYTILKPTVYAFDIGFAGDQATLKCQARCTIRTRQITRPIRSSWQLEFKLIDDQWWIYDLFPREIAGQHFGSIREIPLSVPEL